MWLTGWFEAARMQIPYPQIINRGHVSDQVHAIYVYTFQTVEKRRGLRRPLP